MKGVGINIKNRVCCLIVSIPDLCCLSYLLKLFNLGIPLHIEYHINVLMRRRLTRVPVNTEFSCIQAAIVNND